MSKAKRMPLWSKIVTPLLLIGVVVMVLVLLVGGGMSVLGNDQWLSLQSRVALAVSEPVTNGNGAEMEFDIVPPTFSRGGLPIVSISYVDGITVDFSDSELQDLHFGRVQLTAWARNKTVPEAEAIINEAARAYLEVWILLSDLPPDDRVLEDPPVLLDNERIEKRTGKFYLVITIGYFAVHLYDLTFTEGSFITRMNGLDAGPIGGEWWL